MTENQRSNPVEQDCDTPTSAAPCEVYIDVTKYFKIDPNNLTSPENLVCLLNSSTCQNGGETTSLPTELGHIIQATQLAEDSTKSESESRDHTDKTGVQESDHEMPNIHTNSANSIIVSDDGLSATSHDDIGQILLLSDTDAEALACSQQDFILESSSPAKKKTAKPEDVSGSILHMPDLSWFSSGSKDITASSFVRSSDNPRDDTLVTSLSSPDRPTLPRVRSYNETGDILDVQTQAEFDELVKVPSNSLATEDQQMLGSKQHEFLLHQTGGNEDKRSINSIMLMTPQELEMMPDQGIEFEESVGPKPSTPPPMAIGGEDFDSIVAQLSEFIGGSTVTSEGGVKQIVLSGGSVLNIPKPDSKTTAADKTNKSKKDATLLVKTEKGQQLLHINSVEVHRNTGTAGQQNTITLKCGAGAITKATKSVLKNSEGLDKDGIPSRTIITIKQPLKQLTQSKDSKDGANKRQPLFRAGRQSRLWTCPHEGCKQVFNKPFKFKMHLMKHSGERPFRCRKNDCDWAFMTSYARKKHEEFHENKKEYVCQVEGCGKRFTTVYNQQHHEKLHLRPLKEACELCGEKFATKKQLALHMVVHKGEKKTFKCPHEGCNKMFISSLCMGSHMRVHERPSKYVCTYKGCGREFEQMCRLTTHTRMHTGEKPYRCTFGMCTWSFMTASKLKRHLKSHTQERIWKCNICEKRFLRPDHLKGHLITHSDEKRFACTLPGCEARFTVKSSMLKHLKGHYKGSAVKGVVFYCPVEGCSEGFLEKSDLASHLTRHCQLNFGESASLSLVPILPEEIAAPMSFADNSVAAGSATETITDSESNLSTETSLIDPNQLLNTDSPNSTSLVAYNNGESSTIDASALISHVFAGGTSNSQTSNISKETLISQSCNPLLAENIFTSKPALESTATESASFRSITPGTSLLIPINQQGDQLDPKQKLMVAPTKRKAANVPETKITLHSKKDKSSASGSMQPQTSGSARTDFHQLLMARKKWRRLQQHQENKTAADSITNISESDDGHLESAAILESAAEVADLMTAHGITIRDPDTGAIFVQTQLLQDDPPHPEMYLENDEALESVELPLEFTNTTINMQDLE